MVIPVHTEPTDCDFGFIHAIDEIVTEYKRALN